MCEEEKVHLNTAKTLAAAKDGRCLSTTCVSRKLPLKWRCKLGHEFDQKLEVVKGGSWCPLCAVAAQRLDEARQLAQRQGGKLLSEKYVDSDKALWWKCAKGHKWEAMLERMKREGVWCPRCDEVRFLGAARSLATKKGGKCLSTKYPSDKMPVKWRCAVGHEWEARLDVVTSGGWCPALSASGIACP